MRIHGLLLNATAQEQNTVFNRYVVELRYLLRRADAPDTLHEQATRSVLKGTDNTFFFDLGDGRQVSLEQELGLTVYSPEGLRVGRASVPAVEALRGTEPVKIRIRLTERPPQTPLSLRGKLVWKNANRHPEDFDGYLVLVGYALSATDSETGGARPEEQSYTLRRSDAFSFSLPAAEKLARPSITLTVRYPSGQLAHQRSVTTEALREEQVVAVEAPTPVVVKVDPRAGEAKAEKLKGKVVDEAGRHPIKNKQVMLWSTPGEGAARPIVVATTDGYGNFTAERPKGRYAHVVATVAGTLNAGLDHAVPVDLEDGESDERGARLPKFVFIVVGVGDRFGDEEECDCHGGPKAPRLPDQEDLINNPSAYSQDIGGSCVNFTTPNRTLEEFTFTMVVRTTDPQIKGTTLSDLDKKKSPYPPIYIPPEFLKNEPQPTAPTLSDAVAGVASAVTDAAAGLVSTAMMYPPTPFVTGFINANPEQFAAQMYLKSPWLTLEGYKSVAGRGELSASNSIDWDGTPTFYQAATISHGHVLYYKQVWKADGYSLGDLLYSLPLAPGQKKQIVIFDWDRTEYGRRDEDTHEDEAVNAHLSHNRDILDITQGSVSESMRGGSQAKTSGKAGGIGGGIGAFIAPVFMGVAGGYSSSSGSASSSAWQDSSRTVSASGLNQLRDTIQQGASAVRNQRSTVVQTARQTERFKVQTEVVANYNHCHALTVQYFEVLRHYAIEQKLTHVQECLFIPLLMSEFDEPKVVRWKDILRAALRDPGTRSLFRLSTGGYSVRTKSLSEAFDAVERRFNAYAGTDLPATTYAAETVQDLSGDLYLTLSLNRPRDSNDDAADNPLDPAAWAHYAFFTGWTWHYIYNTYFAKRAQQERDRIFEETIAPKIAEGFVDTLRFVAIDHQGQRHDLPLDATLISRYQREASLYVSIRQKPQAIGLRRDQIAKLVIYTSYDLSQSANSRVIVRSGTFRYRTAHFDGVLLRNDAINNDLKSATISFPGGSVTIPSDNVALHTPLSTEELRNPRKEDEELSRKLLAHLNSHIEYYHKAIWQRMDPDRRYMLLDGFTAPHSGGRSVASVVENRVIGVAGNSLIMPVAPGFKLDPTYQPEQEVDENGRPRFDEQGRPLFKPVQLLDHYEPLTPVPPFRVSVPTRGVFAEAVMGACNSCERKEEERYWRWEESPLPDQPTPISPIGTTPPQRTNPGELTPTPFPTPIVNIQNAPGAPEPGATLAGALGLLGKSDLFPNITGLDQNQKNALQAMLSNQESAKHYADKASELAVQASAIRSGGSTIDSIKKSMADGTLSKEAGQKLIEDAYRAQISGKTPAAAPEVASTKALGNAAVEAVKSGREVKATQSLPDGTFTTVEQKGAAEVTSPTETVLAEVSGLIPTLRQPNDQACWATVATMMKSWKDRRKSPYPIEDVLSMAGPTYLERFRSGEPLPREEKAGFVAALGMVADGGNFASHELDYYVNLVNKYGPVWVTVDVGAKEAAAHARVLYAIKGDGSPERTLLSLIDPATGGRIHQSFLDFVEAYEGLADKTSAEEDLFVQLVRFKDVVGGGEGLALVPTVSATMVPALYTDPLVASAKLQAALDTVVADLRASQPAKAGKIDKLALTLVELKSGDATQAVAGVNQQLTHYSASMVKVAAVYAAFELRAAARRVEAELQPSTGAEFFSAVREAINADIRLKVPLLIANASSITDKHLLPAYETVLDFDATETFTKRVRFKPAYEARLRSIFENQNQNDGAHACIHGVGYGFLNAALQGGGFFSDRAAPDGVWLCGDYKRDWPYVTIPSENDGAVAQAASTYQFAKLITLLALGRLFDGPAACSEMMDLFARGAPWFNLHGIWPANGDFVPTHAKVGEGPLKAGGLVLSDCVIFNDNAHNARFALVWQNLQGAPDKNNLMIPATLVKNTLAAYFA